MIDPERYDHPMMSHSFNTYTEFVTDITDGGDSQSDGPCWGITDQSPSPRVRSGRFPKRCPIEVYSGTHGYGSRDSSGSALCLFLYCSSVDQGLAVCGPLAKPSPLPFL